MIGCGGGVKGSVGCVGKCVEVWEKCWGGVGCMRKCIRVWGKVWGSVLGSGEVLESVLGCESGEKRCGEVWGRYGKL